jgi:hypothetical protein
VSQIILDTLHGRRSVYPTPTDQRKHELREIRSQLMA